MAINLATSQPRDLPITVDQYRLLVEHGTFAQRMGQVELIYGRIVEMNPQGPVHSDPVDELQCWSHEQASAQFRIRIEKPIEIPGLNSSPEPDIVWVTKRRYVNRHPSPEDVYLLIEVSTSSKSFDRGEKLRLYAEAGIREYWIVDTTNRSIEVFTQPTEVDFKAAKLCEVTSTLAPQCLPTAHLAVARLFSDVTK